MIYLAANNSRVWHLRAAGYPMGWMMSPAGWRRPVRDGVAMPYALDNGLFHPFDQPPKPEAAIGEFVSMLDAAGEFHPPMFAVAPDVPYDGAASLARSREWMPRLRERFPGVALALAAQDGMTPDALDGWDWVFIAGSTEWKWAMFLGVGAGGARPGHGCARRPCEHMASDLSVHRRRGGLGGRHRHLSRRQDATARRSRRSRSTHHLVKDLPCSVA